MTANALNPEDLLRNERLRKSVYAWVSDSDADDVVQTVAEKMITKSLRPRLGYVGRMLRNAAYDVYRADSIRSGHEEKYASESELLETRAPDQVLEWSKALEHLCDVLDSLDPVSREIFVRHTVDGETQSSIANDLKVHVSTIEKKFASTRLYCFEQLKPYLGRD